MKTAYLIDEMHVLTVIKYTYVSVGLSLSLSGGCPPIYYFFSDR